jgi:alanyl-tRNA synthetase
MVQGQIKAIYHNKSFLKTTQSIPADARFGLLLDRTNFYAESGGQEHDTGKIMIGMEAVFEVEDVQVFNGYVLHIGHLKYGELNVGSEVDVEYEEVNCRPYQFQVVFIDLVLVRYADGQFGTTILRRTS